MHRSLVKTGIDKLHALSVAVCMAACTVLYIGLFLYHCRTASFILNRIVVMIVCATLTNLFLVIIRAISRYRGNSSDGDLL